MAEQKYPDFPFDDVVKGTNELILVPGVKIHQKFTCQHCGSRQTMEVPNTLYESGRCEACGKVTNIKERGCNYLVHRTF